MLRLQEIARNAAFRPWPGLMAIAVTGGLAGCASIVGSDREALAVNSTPPRAQILISDEQGRTVFRGRTPDRVELEKGSGRYFGGQRYTVAVGKRGYATQRIAVETRPNLLYLGGNLISGGPVGWLLIDPLSGRMYKLHPNAIDLELTPLPGPQAAAERAAAAAAEAELTRATGDAPPAGPPDAASKNPPVAAEKAPETAPPAASEGELPAASATTDDETTKAGVEAAGPATDAPPPIIVTGEPLAPDAEAGTARKTEPEPPRDPGPALRPPPKLPVWPSTALPPVPDVA